MRERGALRLGGSFKLQTCVDPYHPFVLSLRKDGYVIKGNLGGPVWGAFIQNVDAYVVSMGCEMKDDMKHPRVRGPLIQRVRVVCIDLGRYYIWSNHPCHVW